MFLLIFLSLSVGQVCGLFLPGIMADIVNVGIKQSGFEDLSLMNSAMSESEILNFQTSYILKKGVIMIAVTLLAVIFDIITGYLTSKLSSKISLKLRKDMFFKIVDFSYSNFEKFSVSSLVTRTIIDVENVKDMIMTLMKLIILPVMIFGGIFMALQRSISMSGVVILGSLCAVGCVWICFLLITPKIKSVQKLTDNFNKIIKERLSGVQLIRVFGKEKFEHERFCKSNKELTFVSLFVNRITLMVIPLLTTIINIMNVSIVWFGANGIDRGKMNVGDVMAFLQYSTMVITAFIMLSVTISSIPKFWVSAERVFEVLGVEDEKIQRKVHIQKVDFVEFQDVSFKYSGAPKNVLSNLNFKIKAGENIGIIGTTGSGKSTFLKILLGFYRPSYGKVLINGTDVKDIDKKSFSERFSYVPQSGMLFSGNLDSNIKVGNPSATDKEIEEMMEISQMSDFLSKNGMDFGIVKNGSNISGGQRQRIAIARALIHNADVYIFDDSFSGLDFRTDLNIRKALNIYLKNSLKIVVSQRIASVKNSDKIIVLNEGEIVGMGSHEELISSCEIYREMAKLQLGDEIL